LLPFMASGRIVRDYGVLFKYVELLEKRGRGYEARRALPTSEDIEYLKRAVTRGMVRTLDEAIKLLKSRFRERIDVDVAAEAYRRHYGVADVSEDMAVEELSRVLAGYAIEIAEQLGEIRLRNLELLR